MSLTSCCCQNVLGVRATQDEAYHRNAAEYIAVRCSFWFYVGDGWIGQPRNMCVEGISFGLISLLQWLATSLGRTHTHNQNTRRHQRLKTARHSCELVQGPLRVGCCAPLRATV
jgi:hypothetical protein